MLTLAHMAGLHWAQIAALFNVVLIDVTLAVDNAVVMGSAAAKLPTSMRRNAILIGVGAAAFFRVVFACFALRLLSIVGLTLAGGLLLLWVAWKLWRDLRSPGALEATHTKGGATANGAISEIVSRKASNQATLQIIFADLSMSLDNTLAVAGAARDHFWIMVLGLVLSVAFMGLAANFLASLIHKHRWISYIGLLVVLYVALSMIWTGAQAVSGTL